MAYSARANRSFVLTLDGTVQNLGAAFPADAGTAFSMVMFTQQGAAAVYGGESGMTVSSTNYGFTVKASAADPTILSAVGGTPIRLQEIEVIGTASQKLSIHCIAR